jgi:hypothetical protein
MYLRLCLSEKLTQLFEAAPPIGGAASKEVRSNEKAQPFRTSAGIARRICLAKHQ